MLEKQGLVAGFLVNKAEGYYFWLAASNDIPATSGLDTEKALTDNSF